MKQSIAVCATLMISLVLMVMGCETVTTEYSLTITVAGQGTVSPSGGTFDENETVNLIATPGSGWEFSGWSGDASGSQSRIQVVMDSDKTVVATFIEIPCTGDECGDDDDIADAMIIPDPTWTCSMPEGIPSPKNGTLLFTSTLSVGPTRDIGQTPYGRRLVIPVNGGSINGEYVNGSRITGNILEGALDFDLHLPSGAIEHESRYVIRTADGELIYMRNGGVAAGDHVRLVVDFEAPLGSDYEWLNQGTYIGKRVLDSGSMTLSVYLMPDDIPSPSSIVRTPSDDHLVQQDWDCSYADPSAVENNRILRARVGIGSFLSLGSSKYGDRRIIPITGGSFSGEISGSVDEGGADYQLTTDAGLSLEARYTLLTDDGEYILVRNCGDFTTSDLTVPMLETRVDGPYNWLNQTDFVGTITPGFSRVTITVYDH